MKTLRILFAVVLAAFVLAACASDGGGAKSSNSGYPAGYSAAPEGSTHPSPLR